MRGVLKIIIFLSIATTLEAGGFALSGVGSRAIGMAGAFRSVACDWTAIFWNPAGLTQAEYSINLSGIFITPYTSLEPNTGILGYDGPYTMRYKVNAKKQNFIIPSFGFISPYEIKDGRLAFGFFVPFGLGSKWDLYDFPMGYYNTEDTTFIPPEMEKYDWQSDLKVFAFHMGISKRFGKTSLGLSLGPVLTKIYMRRVSFVDPATMEPEATQLPLQYRLFPIDTELEGSGWCLGATFGVLYDFSEKLKIGAAIRYYTSTSLDGTASLKLYFPKNDYIASMLDPTQAFLFSGDVASGSGGVSTEITLPANFGIGISYRPVSNLTLAFDVDYTKWSSFDKIPLEFKDLVLAIGGFIPIDTVEADTLIEEWSNTTRYSFGVEYRVMPALMLRGGIYYDESPVPDTTITPLIPDIGNKIGLNAGFTYDLTPSLSITMNYEYVKAKDRDVKRTSDYSYESHYFAGKYSMKVHAAGIGIEYKF